MEANYPVNTSMRSENMEPLAKRSQVKHACVNCRKACKKCDEVRPCQRCSRYNIECFDTQKKERMKVSKKISRRATASKDAEPLYEQYKFVNMNHDDETVTSSPSNTTTELECSFPQKNLFPYHRPIESQLDILSRVCDMILCASNRLPSISMLQQSTFQSERVVQQYLPKSYTPPFNFYNEKFIHK
ncbi:hypothetical protein HDV01_005031 [Terramyces sp. JEL0728]|nr:hypothetical protein HDV01_005031 [Terramyces sp. JEL0728]